MSNIHLKYRIYTYYLNFELFKYGFVLYYIATRNRHIIVALHRCNIVTRTDNCTAIFPQFLTKHMDIVIDNRYCMVTIPQTHYCYQDRHDTKSYSNMGFCCIILPQETDILLLHYTDAILSLEQTIVLHYSNISFKMYSDMVIDNRCCIVTIHRCTIVTGTDIILKVIQIWVSVVSYCNKKQTHYCCITQMHYFHYNRQL